MILPTAGPPNTFEYFRTPMFVNPALIILFMAGIRVFTWKSKWPYCFISPSRNGLRQEWLFLYLYTILKPTFSAIFLFPHSRLSFNGGVLNPGINGSSAPFTSWV